MLLPNVKSIEAKSPCYYWTRTNSTSLLLDSKSPNYTSTVPHLNELNVTTTSCHNKLIHVTITILNNKTLELNIPCFYSIKRYSREPYYNNTAIIPYGNSPYFYLTKWNNTAPHSTITSMHEKATHLTKLNFHDTLIRPYSYSTSNHLTLPLRYIRHDS